MRYFILTLVWLLSATVALAQTPVTPSVPANNQDINIDSRVRKSIPKLFDADAATEALLTGNGDLILLQKTKRISLSFGLTHGETSNARLSPEDMASDHMTSANIGLTASTRLAKRVDLYAQLGVAQERYARLKELNYGALTSAIGANSHWGPFQFGLAYQPSVIFDDHFKKRKLTQARLSGDLSMQRRIKSVYLIGNLSLDRTTADPKDYNSRGIGLNLNGVAPLTKSPPSSVFLTLGYETRWYDDYFSGLVGSKRTDRRTHGTIGFKVKLTPSVDAVAQLSYARNHSTSDVNRYHAHSGLVGLSLMKAF